MGAVNDIEQLKALEKCAAESAGSALSELLNKKIKLIPSLVNVVSVAEIHRNIFLKVENVEIIIFARLNREFQGELILALDEKCAYRMIDLAGTANPGGNIGELTEMGVSALKETGNIVIGAYLTAVSEKIGSRITPPLSALISGSLESIFLDVIYHPYLPMQQAQRYVLQTDFAVPENNIRGNLSLSLTKTSAEKMVDLLVRKQ